MFPCLINSQMCVLCNHLHTLYILSLYFTICISQHKQRMWHLHHSRGRNAWQDKNGLAPTWIKIIIIKKKKIQNKFITTWQNSVWEAAGTSANAGSDGVLSLWVVFYVQCKQVCAAPGSKPPIESRPVALTATRIPEVLLTNNNNMACDIWSASARSWPGASAALTKNKWEI